jgi:hypothetical protein
MPFDLEHSRKEAKRLVRAFRSGDPEAVRRAEAVLGHRARERFGLNDAQHVVARELGHHSWPDLKHSLDEAEERVVESGRAYREGEPVRVRVRRRQHIHLVTDDGAAVRLAGKPAGWREVADAVVDEAALNLSRGGAIFVSSVYPDYVPEFVERIADTSLAVYEAVLDLDA